MSEAQPRILDGIKRPSDVKALAPADLSRLAQEIRDEIISVTASQGGHVGPNLGVVELTIALHIKLAEAMLKLADDFANLDANR